MSGLLEAALFDLDGLLLDSEGAWTAAERWLFESLGGTWTAGVKAACVGKRIDEIAATLVRLAGAGDVHALQAESLARRIADLFRAGLPPRPGAVALLDALAGEDVPLAVVSSSPRSLVESGLATLGRDRFQAIVCGDEVARPKPHPEPYLLAAAALGASPARSVVFEDSPTGVAAGLAAGCLVVAVPSTVSVAPAPGVSVFESLADVPVDWLLRSAMIQR